MIRRSVGFHGKSAIGWFGDEDNGDEGESLIKERHAEQAEEDACKIAEGHAFDKHGDEFDVDSESELAETVKETIEDATHSTNLENGRSAYYDEETNTLVIIDPSSPDGGTVFKPVDGIDKFDELE